MGCPSLLAAANGCTWGTQRAAAPPIVWCASNTSSVTWNWSKPNGVSEFRTSTSAAAAFGSNRWTTRTGLTDSLNLTGNPGQRLTLYVQAKRNSEDYWSWSGAASCVVKPRTVSIACPTINNTSITWSWTKPLTAATQEISFDGSTWTTHGTGTKEVVNLSPGTERILHVRAKESSVDYWSWTDSKTCSTSLGPPAAPVVECTSTNSSITWEWNRPEGAKKFRYTDDFTLSLRTNQWNVTRNLTHTVSNLPRGTNRTMFMQAGRENADVNVNSDWSAQAWAFCTTTPADPVVTCTASRSSIVWAWRAVTGATQYRWRREGATTWNEADGLSVTIDNLSSGATIEVEVQAGHGEAELTDDDDDVNWSSADSAECTTTTGK